MILARPPDRDTTGFVPKAGWRQVAQTMERAASNYREGKATGFETAAKYVTQDLAYIVEVERFKAKARFGLRTQ